MRQNRRKFGPSLQTGLESSEMLSHPQRIQVTSGTNTNPERKAEDPARTISPASPY
jgi:hypothetical protein